MRVRLLALALASTPLPLLAQAVVGTAVVDGAAVELLADRTWRPVAGAAEGCTPLRLGVAFCADGGRWRPSLTANVEAVASFKWSDTVIGVFFVEELGLAQGLSPEGMRQIVIGNAAQSQGIPSERVPVLNLAPVVVDGVAGETLTFTIVPAGLPFVVQNTILLDEARVVQAVTSSVGPELTPDMIAAHEDLLARIELGPSER